jgi:hypothetical protein
MLSGNTTNPILSGNTVSQGPQLPVPPALLTTLLGPPTGRNRAPGWVLWQSLPVRCSRRNLTVSEWKFDAAITSVPQRLRLVTIVLKPPRVGLNFCPALSLATKQASNSSKTKAAPRHRIVATIQAPWTATQSSPTISAQSPNQTNALKPKIGERTTNIPILPRRRSWLLQYLAKSQMRYPGNAKAMRSPCVN